MNHLLRWYVYLYFVGAPERRDWDPNSDPEEQPTLWTPNYVGKGQGNRDKSHLKLQGSQICWHKRLQYILEHDIPYKIKRVKSDLTEDEAYEHEQKLIAKYKRIEDGGTLYNVLLGGRVAHGKSRDKVSYSFEIANEAIIAARHELTKAGMHPSSDDWMIGKNSRTILALIRDIHAEMIPPHHGGFPYSKDTTLRLYVQERKRPSRPTNNAEHFQVSRRKIESSNSQLDSQSDTE
jgi:hypothetical protein